MAVRTARGLVLAEACAVAMEALHRVPDAMRVAQLRLRAKLVLGGPEAALIGAFGAVFDARRFDAAALRDAGRALLQGALVALQPGPVGGARADIYG